MLIQEFGSILLGFTGEMKCQHCNNLKAMQIRQTYTKQSVLFIPIGTVHKGIFIYCSVCEHKDYLTKWFPAFAGQDKMNYIISLLESGKDYTRYWISQLDYKDREKALKRLNALNAYSLVRYVSNIS